MSCRWRTLQVFGRRCSSRRPMCDASPSDRRASATLLSRCEKTGNSKVVASKTGTGVPTDCSGMIPVHAWGPLRGSAPCCSSQQTAALALSACGTCAEMLWEHGRQRHAGGQRGRPCAQHSRRGRLAVCIKHSSPQEHMRTRSSCKVPFASSDGSACGLLTSTART